jgi:hypothetical protein
MCMPHASKYFFPTVSPWVCLCCFAPMSFASSNYLFWSFSFSAPSTLHKRFSWSRRVLPFFQLCHQENRWFPIILLTGTLWGP